ncbi:MAG: pirin family protein [Anaerolineales bacterium]|nr:MAG: pirin family protein [Anaerolineales bacterium]
MAQRDADRIPDKGTTSRTEPVLAPIAIRRDREIYSADGAWFQARWHFSFDRYYDPENMGVGKLRVFNHDTLVPGAIWPMHPHRDVEGITYVVAGRFEHADSLNNGGVLLPGGVQRMTLGSGALHSERNYSKTEPMQFIQMWIMPDRRGLPPSVEQRQHSEEDRHNKLLQIVRPEGIEGTGVTVHQDVSMHASRLDPGVTVRHEFGGGRGGYLYLMEGDVELNGQRMMSGDAAKITAAGLLRIRSRATSELILVDTPL